MSDLTYDDPRITFLADQVRALLKERRDITLGPTFTATYIALAANKQADELGMTTDEFLRRYGIPADIAHGIEHSMEQTAPENRTAPEVLE